MIDIEVSTQIQKTKLGFISTNEDFDMEFFKTALKEVFSAIPPNKYGADIEKVITHCILGESFEDVTMDFASVLLNNVVNAPYKIFEAKMSESEFLLLHGFLKENVQQWNEELGKIHKIAHGIKSKEFESSNRANLIIKP